MFKFCLIIVLIVYVQLGIAQNSFSTLDSAFISMGFHSSDKDSWFFVTAGDLHYHEDGNSRGGHYIIDQIIGMKPTPAFFIVPGDVVNHASLSMGEMPIPKDREIAKKEFEQAKADFGRLPKDVKLYVTVGNHDTYPLESHTDSSRLFYNYFDTVPQFFSYKGTAFFLLDGGSHANYDIDNQIARMDDYVKKNVKKDETVFVIQHFPYVGQNYMAGLPSLLLDVFGNHTGKVWNIVGHDHLDRDRVYTLPKTVAIENTVSGGYTIYCIRKGEVVGRLLHPRKEGLYTVLQLPKSEGKVLKPFEDIDGMVWSTVIGKDISTSNCPYLVKSDANDAITNWVYTKYLEYKFPYPKEIPNEFGLMVQSFFYQGKGKGMTDKGVVYGSIDGENWVDMPFDRTVHDVAIYTIPSCLQRESDIFMIKIKGPYFRYPHPAAGKIMDNTIGGFAFIKR